MAYIPGLDRFLARAFGGVTPEVLLSDEEMARLKPVFSRTERRVIALVLPVLIAMAAGGTYGMASLCVSVQGAPVDPVFDTRTSTMWLCLGLFHGIAALVAMACVLTLRPVFRGRTGQPAELYDRYVATRDGWLPRRNVLALVIMALPLFGMFLYTGWNLGERVDETGIRHGLASTHKPYDAVSSVAVYNRLSAPIGIVHRPCLRVEFTDGSRWDWVPNRRMGAKVAEVSAHIAERAGTQIQFGDLRP